MSEKKVILDKKSHKFPIFEIITLISIAIGLRFIFFDSEIPLVLDSLTYFSFSYETKILGHFPEIIPFTNLGWPVLLTVFFTMFPLESAIDYMNLQKIISMILSSITIIPIYLLCKKFSERKYALGASSIFIFDPRIIENSVLGITDGLYILMMTSVFVLFFNTQKKIVYISFFLAALTTLVRAEGVFVFLAISIMFFMRFRNEKRFVIKYLIGFGIFILILSPILIERIELFQNEFITQPFEESENVEDNQLTNIFNLIFALENYVKFLAWVTIPIYILFLIPGCVLIFKKWKKENAYIFIPIITMSIPILYAYSIPAEDTRYLFVLLPFFSIIATFSIKSLVNNMKNTRKILPLILIIVIISSTVFLYERIDMTYERESKNVAEYIVKNAQGVNAFEPEGKFFRASEVINDFPKIPYKESGGEFTHKIKIFNIKENSLSDFIKNHKNDGLTHIITDENQNRNNILIDIFNNEQNYPVLEKILDTKDLEWNHHYKIFKINYNEFEKE